MNKFMRMLAGGLFLVVSVTSGGAWFENGFGPAFWMVCSFVAGWNVMSAFRE